MSSYAQYIKSQPGSVKPNRGIDTLEPPSVLANLPYSLLKLEVVTSGGLSSHHLFVARTTLPCSFTLGRAAECDIVISQNTISREQCRFYFAHPQYSPSSPLKWYIRDGSEQRESSNGTWLCLTDYRLRQFKMES
jgi:FHA domain